jgi:hypothetical protein
MCLETQAVTQNGGEPAHQLFLKAHRKLLKVVAEAEAPVAPAKLLPIGFQAYRPLKELAAMAVTDTHG